MRLAYFFGVLAALAACGSLPPNEASAEAAVRGYLAEHRDVGDAEFFASARVTDVGPCAMTTLEKNALTYVCPIAFQDEHGAVRRAFANLTPQFPSGWRVASFDPIEKVEE